MYTFMPKEALQSVMASMGLWFDEGVFDLKPDKTLNGLFPDIKPKKVRQLLEEAWKTS